MKSGESTSERILIAATRLLSSKGYANVSMRDIAKEADVALSMLTYYFLTKDNLVRCVAERVVKTCVDDIGAMADGAQSQEDYLKLISEYFLKASLQENEAMRILVDFSTQSIWNTSFKKQAVDFLAHTVEIIKEKFFAKENVTVFNKYSLQTATVFFLSCLYGMSLQSLITEDNRPADLFDFTKTVIEKFFESK